MKTPEIRIFYAWLYKRSVSKPLYEHFQFDEPLEDDKKLEEYAENYRQAWSTYEAKIVPALCDSTGLEFYQSIIDVACMPGVKPASEPIIISFRTYPDQFVDVLTHELCHVLLTDNTTLSFKSDTQTVNLLERWQLLFSESHTFNCLVHIPVHALCKYVYLDVLHQPERFERDMKDVNEWPDYKAAWDYVNTHDYKEIIEQIKLDFKQLRSD